MQNKYFNTLKNQSEKAGYEFETVNTVIDHKGRSRTVNFLNIKTGVRGKKSEAIETTLIHPHNKWVREEAEKEIERELAQEEAAAQEKEAAFNLRIKELESQLAGLIADGNQSEEEKNNKLAQLKEEFERQREEEASARKKPIKRITAYFGLTLTVLVALVLVGLNYFNATFFLGQNLHWTVLATFSLLFGASFVYFALSRNSSALKLLVWVIPFDLVIATLVKPFLGASENGFTVGNNWETLQVGNLVGLLLFLSVYGVQLYHAGNAVAKLLNPRDLTKKEEEQHLEDVLESIQ